MASHIDAESKILEILSNELAREIDKSILAGLGISIKSRKEKIEYLLNECESGDEKNES